MQDKDFEHEGIFPHKCSVPSCTIIVKYDDEPNCFTHSPDSGSHMPGYSARRESDRWQLMGLDTDDIF